MIFSYDLISFEKFSVFTTLNLVIVKIVFFLILYFNN